MPCAVFNLETSLKLYAYPSKSRQTIFVLIERYHFYDTSLSLFLFFIFFFHSRIFFIYIFEREKYRETERAFIVWTEFIVDRSVLDRTCNTLIAVSTLENWYTTSAANNYVCVYGPRYSWSEAHLFSNLLAITIVQTSVHDNKFFASLSFFLSLFCLLYIDFYFFFWVFFCRHLV